MQVNGAIEITKLKAINYQSPNGSSHADWIFPVIVLSQDEARELWSLIGRKLKELEK